ncbi:hypothetical protein JIG36_30365 [Actinoplanes sp. LDG1-06]|uniref:Uncharacterized protein n=1 Tax=Paractinoplanes ovalisporus TaxID=2810368 RepID=A0ABS2AKC3_9ACTN|nr:hypothetical protein [Actinoplanes ovalisporus]MBM2619823.1 hypothetical protein [Actinoplanes ovalisporus]
MRFWFGGAAIYSLAVSVVLVISLFSTEGGGVALVLAVPAVVSGLPALLGAQRIVAWGCIGLLAGFVLIGAASVGLFYVPALIMLLIGARQMMRAA